MDEEELGGDEAEEVAEVADGAEVDDVADGAPSAAGSGSEYA